MRVVKECRKAMHGFRGWYENVQEILKLQNSQYENPVSRDVMKSDMEKLVIENNRLLMENKDLMDELENSRLRMASSSYEQVKSNQKWNEEAIILRNSYSFRLGQIFVNAVNRPGKDTLLMPYYLLRFFWEIVSGRGRKNVSTSSKQWLN